MSLWPLVALAIAALFRGALKSWFTQLEARLGIQLEQGFEAQVERLAEMAIDWVCHKMPRAHGDGERRFEKLTAAISFVHEELEARGYADMLREWSEERIGRLIEGLIAERKRDRGELKKGKGRAPVKSAAASASA